MSSRIRKLLVALAILLGIGATATFLTIWLKWEAYLAAVQPDYKFDASKLPAAPNYAKIFAWVVRPEAPALSTVTPGSLQASPVTEARADVFSCPHNHLLRQGKLERPA